MSLDVGRAHGPVDDVRGDAAHRRLGSAPSPPQASRPEPSQPDPRRHPDRARVTVVVVARDGEHLAAVLAGLRRQTRTPDRAVGVDASGAPAGASTVAAPLAAGTAEVLTLAPTSTTGDAVAAAVAVSDAAGLAPTPDPRPEGAPDPASDPAREPGDWLWVLDDRSVPHPEALAELVAAVERSPRIALAGCKHRGGPDGRHLVAAGTTTSRWGRRLTGTETDEVDQGQLDDREDVLAVPFAGMLVRRDVLEAVRGTDPFLPDDGADVDLGRRVHLAGHRVVVVPKAVLTRAPGATAAHGSPPERPPTQRPLPEPVASRSLLARHPAGAARRDAAYLRLVAAHWWALPAVAVSVLVGGGARWVLGVATKEPARGAAALAGALTALAHPRRVHQARGRARRAGSVPRSELTSLQAGAGETGRWHRARWSDRREDDELAVRSPQTLLERPPERSREELADARPDGPSAPVERRGAAAWSAAALAVVLAAVSAVALVGVVGGARAQVPGTTGELWAAARSGWRAAGVGHREPADPLLSVLAALSAVVGLPSTAVTVLLLTAMPAAGLGAWWAAGALTRAVAPRVLAGVTWAAAPSLLAALVTGRLGAVVAHAALPVAVRCLASAALVPHRRMRLCWAGAGALALVPVTTGAPVLVVPVAAVAVAVAVASRAPRVVVALLPSLALAAPRLVAGGGDPAAGLSDPGPMTAYQPAHSWQVAFGWPQLPQAWPGVGEVPGLDVLAGDGGRAAAVLVGLSALPLLLAVLALPVAAGLWSSNSWSSDSRSSNGRSWDSRSSDGRSSDSGHASAPSATARAPHAARWGLALAVVGLGLGVLASRTVVLPADAGSVRAWPGAGAGLVVLGLLLAGLSGLAVLSGHPQRPPRSSALVAGAVATLLLLPATGLAVWAAAAVRADTGSTGTSLPAVVTDVATSSDQARVLALRALPGGVLGVSLLRGEGPSFESAGTAAPTDDEALDALDRAAVDLVSGVADPRPRLAAFGVGAVVVLPGQVGPVADGGPADDPAGAPGAGQDAVAAGVTSTAALSAALDATGALSPSGQVDGLRAWRVEAASGPSSTSADRPGALRVVAGDGSWTVLPSSPYGASATVADGPADRVLALAERRDPGWTATLDGRELEPTTVEGWAQGWVLPADGGALEVRHEGAASGWWGAGWWGAGWWGAVQAALLALAVLAALPVLRPGKERR